MFFRNFYEAFDFVTTSTFPVYVYEFSFYGHFNWYTKTLMRDPSITSNFIKIFIIGYRVYYFYSKFSFAFYFQHNVSTYALLLIGDFTFDL